MGSYPLPFRRRPSSGVGFGVDLGADREHRKYMEGSPARHRVGLTAAFKPALTGLDCPSRTQLKAEIGAVLGWRAGSAGALGWWGR